MNRNVARGRETREHLVRVATRLFATQGYEGTSIEAVLQETGVSRGSLYHHFPGKEALFLAVFQELEVRVVAEIAGSVAGLSDPVEAIGVACLAWIRMAGDPEVQQIVLTDAPAVLGWQRWRELDEENVLGQFRMAIAAAADAGRVDPRHVDVFAHLVVAAVNEAAILVARSPDPAAALPGAQDAFKEFLRRLLG
ncbi:TetR/AcrR family transcriptional regulator [Actinoplanes sp. CA-142083]|uniref:TetR/AcrR family transcriptional regulator n=1 Tax=Actinoplanes sp. CA-142083 TaxID=3239903 RepID=UPI003D8F53EC